MTSNEIKGAVRVYLNNVVEDRTDTYTGEVNCTEMAEEAAMTYNLYGPGPEYEIPEWVYEYAVDVAASRARICERCNQRKRGVYRRAEHGRLVCGGCHEAILLELRPSRLVPRPRNGNFGFTEEVT